MPTETVPDAATRAATAAESVTAAFGHRLFGLPATHIASVRLPRPTGGPWHYWWQAHYLDCLLDAAQREGHNDDGDAYRARARRLLRTIRLRNGGRWRNDYYDDMAWLALAALRSADVAGTRPLRALGRVLASAHTADLGGGLFWNVSRDFKNTPATGPAALYFARTGRRKEAAQLVDWLYDTLFDASTGLFLDGIRAGGLVRDVYTYNQGPVLGALLVLGDAASLQRASALVEAVSTGLVLPSGALRTHGGGDGGLFTGILVRYLALAAASGRLPAPTRAAARALITTTADTLWDGRTVRVVGQRHRTGTVFPSEPATDGACRPVELSTQLQAWMMFEAAYRVNEENQRR